MCKPCQCSTISEQPLGCKSGPCVCIDHPQVLPNLSPWIPTWKHQWVVLTLFKGKGPALRGAGSSPRASWQGV